MASSSSPFASWSEIDHSGPIVVITLLAPILGLMVYIVGMIIKFTSSHMRSHGWWNNVFWTLTVFFSLGESIIVLLACRLGLGKSKSALHEGRLPTIISLYYASTLLYVVTLWLAKCFALFFLKEEVSASMTWTWRKKLYFWTPMSALTSWMLASIVVLISRCVTEESRAKFGSGCIEEWIAIFVGDVVTDVLVVCFAIVEIWPLQMNIRRRVKAISICAIRLFVPALAASRLYLYCSKKPGDPTITLWSTLVITQLQVFAAHACTFGFVITERMNGMVSHFGLANQAPPSGPTETYHSQRTQSSKGPVRGDGESQTGIIMKTFEYEVKEDEEAGRVEKASQGTVVESSAWARETAQSSGRW